MPEQKDSVSAEQEADIRKEKRYFFKGVLLFFLVLSAATVTWIWNLNASQKDVYLRFLGFDGLVTEDIKENLAYPAILKVHTSQQPVVLKNVDVPIPEEVHPTTLIKTEEEVFSSEKKAVATIEASLDVVPERKPVAVMSVTDQSEDVVQLLQKLMAEIHELRLDLRQNQQDQMMLHQANIARQQLDFHTRLRWILMPNNHWVHLHMYWQDIASLPMLTEQQRVQAIAQADIARKQMQSILLWREQMHLIVREIQNQHQMVTKPSILKLNNPWLSWLSDHFSLSRTQPKHLEALDHLQYLIQESMLMGLGQWPDEKRWMEIYREILMYFPEKKQIHHINFASIQQDKQAMEALAVHWLGE